MNFKLLKDLYGIHSKSGSEACIIRYICNWIRNNIPEATIKCDTYNGNIYITKGISESYPCMVAHLDQVQTYHPKDFVAIETRDLIIGYSPNDRKQAGLGADDKNGIWMSLICLQKHQVMKCAFFSQEEVGCRGASKADMDFFKDVRFVIEPDRRGNSDMVTEIAFSDLCSQEFIKTVDSGKYGYKKTSGLMTDILELKEQGLAVSCINISCGYYEPHTDHEFTNKRDLIKSFSFADHIISECTNVYPHVLEWEGYYGKLEYTYYDMDYYDELYEIISSQLMEDPTLEPMDIYELYKNEYPGISADIIAEIYDDAKYAIKLLN